MRSNSGTFGVSKLCGLFGKSRQAWYESNWNADVEVMENAIVLELIHFFRHEMPKIGGHKLHYLLQPALLQNKIKMGRDKLFELMRDNGLLLKRKRKYTRTTNSNHWLRKYSNLIRELEIVHVEQLWVCDITYITTTRGFAYLSLITDAYSHKIVGYHLNRTLSNDGSLIALGMALKTLSNGTTLIHHSDRGIQYCSKEYVALLQNANILISMTENGDPYENAVAERMNGILKTEFALDSRFSSLNEANKAVVKGIQTYNSLRPHSSCNYATPAEAHLKTGVLEKKWKNYYRLRKEQKALEVLKNQNCKVVSGIKKKEVTDVKLF